MCCAADFYEHTRARSEVEVRRMAYIADNDHDSDPDPPGRRRC
jgi:hypothetical protein